MPKFTKIVSRPRAKDEIPTPKVGIRNFCIECMGGHVQEIAGCTAPGCWLYPWRMGKTPEDLKRAGHGGAGLTNYRKKLEQEARSLPGMASGAFRGAK